MQTYARNKLQDYLLDKLRPYHRKIKGKLDHYRNRLRRQKRLAEEQRRRALPLFEYRALAHPLPCVRFYQPEENNILYGNQQVLQARFSIDADTVIEHGVYFGGFVPDFAKQYSVVITYSEYRKQYLQTKSNHTHIVCAGPYIAYATPVLNDLALATLKKSLGRVLLVFPSHSIDSVHALFDENEFIRFIESKRDAYDNVLICLYWKDIEIGHDVQYIKQGYQVVCAGHNTDRYFLDRLKTIIQLADMTLSNNIGTHIGYCIHLGKPHSMYHADVGYISGADGKAAYQELNAHTTEEMTLLQQEKQNFQRLFAPFEEVITPAQQACVDHYWGVVAK